MPTRTLGLMGLCFIAPIVVCLVMHKDALLDDLTPRPENGQLIYVTMDR